MKAFSLAKFPELYGVCIYAFMCHHSLPSIISPIKDKAKVCSPPQPHVHWGHSRSQPHLSARRAALAPRTILPLVDGWPVAGHPPPTQVTMLFMIDYGAIVLVRRLPRAHHGAQTGALRAVLAGRRAAS